MSRLDSLGRLASLSGGARRNLLRLLTASDEEHARLIGAFYDRSETKSLADVLIELASDELIRVQVVELLEELER